MTANASSAPPRISEDALTLLQEEERALDETEKRIAVQLSDIAGRLERERLRARELTSGLVSTRRDDDRSQLASDEAVSHALVGQQDEALQVLQKQRDKPYFARVVLEEEDDAGRTRKIEYKIGHAANPDCRIIDWRRAPISKLYYEYREGDEYSEQIQGRDRLGRILLRNQVEIEKARLRRVTCRYGTFSHNGSEWLGGGAGRSSNRDFSALPEVLSLITPAQFQAITQDAASAVLIQGVAGSGKTTVALHRLAWLLDKGNSDLDAQDCVILTLSPSLRDYVRATLPALGLQAVQVLSYREWCSKQLAPHLPEAVRRDEKGLFEVSSGEDRPSASVERVKRSMGVLRALEELAKLKGAAFQDNPIGLIVETLSDSRLVKSLDTSKLLTDDVIKDAKERTMRIVNRGSLDRSDFALLLRALQRTKGRGAVLGRAAPYRHIVLDEVQDYSPVELATVLSVVTETGNVTLMGDTAQRVEEGFPGWTELSRFWRARKVESNFLKLDVSHRSTKEIVTCASHLAGIVAPVQGRKGKKPEWFVARQQEPVLGAVLEWLDEVIREEPTALVAIVCFSAKAVKELHSMLTPKFGPLVRVAEEGTFSFEEGILICEAATAKGLEFYGVLVYQPTISALPKGEVGRNLLYIAATRAQERLAFATFGAPAPLLSSARTAILNKVDLDVLAREREEEENAQE